MYYHEATILLEAHQSFPFDMLRYDSCYPLTSDDIPRMLYPHDPGLPREVRVGTRTNSKESPWTIARWASFGVKIKITAAPRKL